MNNSVLSIQPDTGYPTNSEYDATIVLSTGWDTFIDEHNWTKIMVNLEIKDNWYITPWIILHNILYFVTHKFIIRCCKEKMWLLSMIMRQNLCTPNASSRQLNRELSIRRFPFRSAIIHFISFTVIVILHLCINHNVQASFSTSKSQLKHERNGRCK